MVPRFLRRTAARLRPARQPLADAAAVAANLTVFDRLVGEAVTDDSLEDLHGVLEVLDPRSRGFGSDVAELIDHCVEHQILEFTAPITGIRIEPTTCGESRDGGFLVLVTISDRITLASHRVAPDTFQGAADTARLVLAAIVETADHACRNFTRTGADLLRTVPSPTSD